MQELCGHKANDREEELGAITTRDSEQQNPEDAYETAGGS